MADVVEPVVTDEVVVDQVDVDKTFTQAELDAVVAGRLQRESGNAKTSVLSDLGVEDLEQAKADLKAYSELKESQKTDADKQAEQLAKATEKTLALESENSQLEAKVTALGQGVESDSLNDVIALASTYVTDDINMEKAIEQVLEKYPQFKGGTGFQPSGQSVLPGNPKRTSMGGDDAFNNAVKKFTN